MHLSLVEFRQFPLQGLTAIDMEGPGFAPERSDT
jgi:hypothetical protein